jgi:hypothetical protein
VVDFARAVVKLACDKEEVKWFAETLAGARKNQETFNVLWAL